MTHDELLAKIDSDIAKTDAVVALQFSRPPFKALRAVVELHKPIVDVLTPLWRYSQCAGCNAGLPCATIEVIEKELK